MTRLSMSDLPANYDAWRLGSPPDERDEAEEARRERMEELFHAPE